MAGSGQVGVLSRMLIDTSASFSNTSFYAEFLSESIVQNIEILNSAGIRGTRAQASERNRRGNETVTGSINFEMSKALLDVLLPGVLGANESTDVFNVAEALPNLYFLVDKGTDICLVSKAKIGKMTITGEQSQIVKVDIDIEAESLTWGQSWPSPAPTPDISRPYFFSDLGDITIGGSGRKCFNVEISVDNGLITDQFANQLTRAGLINASDRVLGFNASVPATTANSSLTAQTVSGSAISAVFTNADETGNVVTNSTVTVALGPTSFTTATPTVGSKGQLVIPLKGTPRALGHAGASTKDIAITNVAASSS